jgi:ArsR family transcriptional regulator
MPELKSPFGGRFGRGDAERLATALKVIAEPRRLQILSILWHTDCVADISQADIIRGLGGLPQPTVAHHMLVLARAGYVAATRTSTTVTYRLTPDGVIAVAVAINPAAGQ